MFKLYIVIFALMLSPTSVLITVRQARHLLAKSKDGINKAYVTIEWFKEKYVTDVEASLTPKWFTECAFHLSSDAFINDKAVFVFCIFHKSHGFAGLGPDAFLGQVQIPLSDLHYGDEAERIKWYKIVGKKNSEIKERGEIELSFRFSFSRIKTEKNGDKLQRAPVKKMLSKVITKLRLSRVAESTSSHASLSPSQQDTHSDNILLSYNFSSFDEMPTRMNAATSPLKLTIASNSSREVRSTTMSSPSHMSSATTLHPHSAGREPAGKRREHHPSSKSTKTEVSITEQGSNSFADLPLARAQSYDTIVISKRMESSTNTPVKKQSSISEKKCTSQSARRRNSFWGFSRYKHGDVEKRSDVDRRTDVSDALLSPYTAYSTSYDYSNHVQNASGMSRVQLQQLVKKQQQLLEKKNLHIRELEDYIDKLLVKVMTCNPLILDEANA